MDRAAIETFLTEPRIMLLAASRDSKEPFVAPVWFEYQDGRVLIWTGAATAKIRVLRRNPAVTLCVQQEAAPYKAVLVRGRAEVRLGADWALVRRLAVRYMGAADAETFVQRYLQQPDNSQVTIIVTPVTWRAWDYGESEGTDRAPWIPDAVLR